VLHLLKKTRLILLTAILLGLQGCSVPTLLAGTALGITLASSHSWHKDWHHVRKKYF
jgi:hypothetical protein